MDELETDSQEFTVHNVNIPISTVHTYVRTYNDRITHCTYKLMDKHGTRGLEASMP